MMKTDVEVDLAKNFTDVEVDLPKNFLGKFSDLFDSGKFYNYDW